eukprot:TRINITY_DN3226_c0_g1_i1.p1 TRINITY_DN3226_c0_g1~~TRINITY_DN3226_c0_g1_i1.p1  ORF type:complete len:188 (-),score=19.87 TRINITY_DN3226_c0_g1_i1:96-659(-)
MHDIDSVFEKFSYSPIFKEIIKAIGFQNPLLVQSMVIFKNPKIGGAVPPHKDNTFLITKPLSCTGIWVALEDAKKGNGCMYGVPGSHNRPPGSFMVRNEAQDGTVFVNEGDGDVTYDTNGAVCLEAPKGSVVLLHGSFLHFSDDNTSPHSRWAYTMHYVEKDAQWDPRNWLQRDETLPFRPSFEVTV